MAQISLKEQVGGKNKLNPKLAEGRKQSRDKWNREQ